MSGAPLVSVIVPTYNGGRYLADCLDSLFAQTCTALEIILVDDASPEAGSRELCRQLAEQDGRVRLCQQEVNTGQALARQRGLELATGRYVAFVDHDDLLVREALQHMVQAAEAAQAEVVHSAGRYLLDENSGQAVYLQDDREQVQAPQLLAAGVLERYAAFADGRLNGFLWNKLFRRSFLLREGICFEDIPNNDDWLFTLLALRRAERYLLLPKSYYIYRLSADSQLRQPKGEKQLRRELMTWVRLGRILSRYLQGEDCLCGAPEVRRRLLEKFLRDPEELLQRWGMGTASAAGRERFWRAASAVLPQEAGAEAPLLGYLMERSLRWSSQD